MTIWVTGRQSLPTALTRLQWVCCNCAHQAPGVAGQGRVSGLSLRAAPCFPLHRYGTLRDLVSTATQRGGMRTLIRVLSRGGPRGSAALLQVSKGMRLAANAQAASVLMESETTTGGDTGEFAEACSPGMYSTLDTGQLYQLLYWSYLSLGLTDAAGTALMTYLHNLQGDLLYIPSQLQCIIFLLLGCHCIKVQPFRIQGARCVQMSVLSSVMQDRVLQHRVGCPSHRSTVI